MVAPLLLSLLEGPLTADARWRGRCAARVLADDYLGIQPRGERTSALEKRDCPWDEAATLGTYLLSRADPSPINRVCALTELGLIRGRRSEAGAWDYLGQATDADRSGEPQRIVPARLAR